MTKKEFVSMSLPYKLKVLIPESNTKGCRKKVIATVCVVFDDGSINCYDAVNACPKWYKPVLYPLSDAYKMIKSDKLTVKTFLDAQCGIINIDAIQLFELIQLVKSRFDVAGLIAKGQAIDVNSLKVNPYKKK